MRVIMPVTKGNEQRAKGTMKWQNKFITLKHVQIF